MSNHRKDWKWLKNQQRNNKIYIQRTFEILNKWSFVACFPKNPIKVVCVKVSYIWHNMVFKINHVWFIKDEIYFLNRWFKWTLTINLCVSWSFSLLFFRHFPTILYKDISSQCTLFNHLKILKNDKVVASLRYKS
jgi:hypothetical protein